MFSFSRNAISRAISVVVVIVVILILAVSGFIVLTRSTSSTSSTSLTSSISSTSSTSSTTQSTTIISTTSTSSSTGLPTSSESLTSTSSSSSIVSSGSTTTTSSAAIPQSFTWETAGTPEYLDPHVSTGPIDLNVLQNVFEPLLWYQGSATNYTIPWLAQNYTVSPDGRTVNFTLRSGIKFADGEPLNSTAVYFSLNRLLVIDSSTPASHGSGPTFLIGQLLNSSISYGFGGTHPYNQAFVNNVLAQNFVQVTGPLTFSLHFLNPSVAWPYFFTIGTTDASDAMAPIYVMEHDLALWNQSSTGYTLPYPSLTGNLTSMTYQYLLDEAATCDNGLTPHGCGQTYLDESSQGSLAGTGPYVVKSFAASTGDVVLSANPSYWGGPSGSIKPQIPTININYVPDETSRELDLKNAALAGNGMTVDITADHLYDVASRAAWLNNGSLVSITPGVTLYGPYTPFETNFDPFVLNVSNPFSGELYTFQPFADIRFRLAFADSVNLTNINTNVNNNMGKVATELIPPGLPPSGAYNSSLPTRYSLNLTATQNLLLDAMMHPITTFHFTNGTVAPQGFFNNTFGCATLNSNNQCSSPAAQTVPLVFPTGDTVDESIDEQMAQVVNNISSTYNMGLTVSVIPLPFGQMVTRFFSAQQYFFSWGWTADYPWALDFLGPMFAVNAAGFAAADNWNLTQMTNLYGQAAKATSSNNVSGVVTVSNAMNELANQEVMYLYTFNPVSSFASSFSAISPITSNIQGYYFNAATSGIYYAALY